MQPFIKERPWMQLEYDMPLIARIPRWRFRSRRCRLVDHAWRICVTMIEHALARRKSSTVDSGSQGCRDRLVKVVGVEFQLSLSVSYSTGHHVTADSFHRHRGGSVE